jgi:hypothetical protein
MYRPSRAGMLTARAARSIPGSVRFSTFVPATAAPVCPAVDTPSTRPSFINRAQIVIDESFFARMTEVEGSLISITVSACSMVNFG